jgi:hypothetical protein
MTLLNAMADMCENKFQENNYSATTWLSMIIFGKVSFVNLKPFLGFVCRYVSTDSEPVSCFEGAFCTDIGRYKCFLLIIVASKNCI